MKIEHINENTIHVLIGYEGLEERGISFLDLLGSHKEIENLFYSILEEVDIEEEFQGSEAITFQVLPKGDELELFISRNLPDEEVSQSEDSAVNSEDVSEFLRQRVIGNDPEEELSGNVLEEQERQAIFAPEDFEQVIQLTTDVGLGSAWTDLYLSGGRYCPIARPWMENLNQAGVENQITRVLELTEESNRTPGTLSEYGKCLMARNAIERTKFHSV